MGPALVAGVVGDGEAAPRSGSGADCRRSRSHAAMVRVALTWSIVDMNEYDFEPSRIVGVDVADLVAVRGTAEAARSRNSPND